MWRLRGGGWKGKGGHNAPAIPHYAAADAMGLAACSCGTGATTARGGGGGGQRCALRAEEKRGGCERRKQMRTGAAIESPLADAAIEP